MTRAWGLQDVRRQMQFEELYERRQQRSLTMAQAGAILRGRSGRFAARVVSIARRRLKGCKIDRSVDSWLVR